LNTKQQSNPFSTGSGGAFFETRVQSAFVILMLTCGFAPCLPQWPIKKIKLQGKYDGYNTDDFIVFTSEAHGAREAKMLAQIKHSISITPTNSTFYEVIQAAWGDFCNLELFNPDRDVIALITGPLSASDINNVRTILEWARDSENAADFLLKVEKTNFSSNQKREKLKAFRSQLIKASGSSISDEQLWRFMKCFHLLGYDLDIKAGVTLSLLHSLIANYSQGDVEKLWLQVKDVVESKNQNAGTIDFNNLPEDILQAFKERVIHTIPEELIEREEPSQKSNFFTERYATDLALAALLGNWDESNNNDRAAIEKFVGIPYAEWISRIREIYLQPESPLILKENRWKVNERIEVLNSYGVRLFDEHLESFKELAVSILRERNPKFELEPDQRFAANIYGKALSNSQQIRKGIAEGLAYIGCNSEVLSSCSQYKAEKTARLSVREIINNADWVLWASLGDLLPVLAEASPNEFILRIEDAISKSPEIFDDLFKQESSGLTGANYMTGILWAMEVVAWDSDLLLQAVMLLGELASRDPGGNWGNRPAKSLTYILLPWFPQTNASIGKRKNAVTGLISELPDVAWRLILSLLPSVTTNSSGTYKPVWRNKIDKDNSGKIPSDYWEQVTMYSELAVNMAKTDFNKLCEIIDYLDDLPASAFDNILAYLDSEKVLLNSDDYKALLWTKLIDLVIKHRKFSDAKWAMTADKADKIYSIADKFKPTEPKLRYKRLFSTNESSLFEEKGNFEEQRKRLAKRRNEAIKEIYETEGIKGVFRFAEMVDSAKILGGAVGLDDSMNVDKEILPTILDIKDKYLLEFAEGFVWRRFWKHGWQWGDALDLSEWNQQQVIQILMFLPFMNETWIRVEKLLGKDGSLYWTRCNVNPYDANEELEIAIERLIYNGRPNEAIKCLNKLVYDGKILNTNQAVKALLAVINSPTEMQNIDVNDVVEIIKLLQNDESVNSDDLFRIEWAYLPLLDEFNHASPMILGSQLANNGKFFCEVVRVAFRSKKEEHNSKELTDHQQNIATNAYRLLHNWKVPPGSIGEGFSGDAFRNWLKQVKLLCAQTGHLEVAMIVIGQVLIHAPEDPSGLWIHKDVAAVLNDKESKDMREGFTTSLFNSQGDCWSSDGEVEKELSRKCKEQAREVELYGYHRLSRAMMELAESYEHEAEWHAARSLSDEL
jgi:hypothetical protein